MSKRTLIAALAAALALSAAGCGGDDEADTADTATGTTPAEAAPAEPQGAGTDTAAGDDAKTKPEIEKPSGEPPGELETDDLVEGDGKEARSGDNVEVHYVGVSFSTGEQFDASWDRGAPFSFALGQGEVIPGWDEGVAGMKEGGRRRLVIPPEKAYGETGAPPAIGPNETLIFVIDLLKVQ